MVFGGGGGGRLFIFIVIRSLSSLQHISLFPLHCLLAPLGLLVSLPLRDSPRPQISVKNCCDTLSILSLVTDSRAVELSPRLPDLAPAVNHFFI